MEKELILSVLGIQQIESEEQLKNAYRSRLVSVNPEDDPEGFKRLRTAYEEALKLYKTKEQEEDEEETDNSPVGVWLQKAEKIYKILETRLNQQLWEDLLKDPVCMELDTAEEAREKMLVFLMDHYYLPREIWQLLDKEFQIKESKKELMELFPRNFLDYAEYQIDHDNFFSYDLTEELEDDANVDGYIRTYLDIKAGIDQEQLENPEQHLDELKAFHVYHPFEDVERCRLYLNRQEFTKAKELIEGLYEKYSGDIYISYYTGSIRWENKEYDSAYQAWSELVEKYPDHYSARVGILKYYMETGAYKEAKDLTMELLEINVGDQEVEQIMRQVNEKLIEQYEKEYKEDPDNLRSGIELVWCLFQNEKYDYALWYLDAMEPTKEIDYDYVNVKSRCLFMAKRYKEALPELIHWSSAIDGLEDDGSEKYQKRKKRKAYAEYLIGFTYQSLKNNERAVEHFEKSIRFEESRFSRLSYMEHLAQLYNEMEAYEKTIDICDEIIADDAGYYPAYLHRQEAYYSRKDAQNVIDDYYRAIDIYPKYFKPYLFAIKVFFVYRQYDDALGVIERAKENEALSNQILLYEIKCKRCKAADHQERRRLIDQCDALYERLDQEENDIEDVTEIDVEKTLLYMDMEDYANAHFAIDEALKKKPGHLRYLWIKADIFMNQGRYEDALAVQTDISNHIPENPDIFYDMGICCEKLNKRQEARKYFEITLEKNPEHGNANNKLMSIHETLFNITENQAEYETALRYATRQLEIRESAYYYVERGLLYFEGYELEKAIADYERALELEPDDVFAYNNAGYTYQTMGDIEKAKKMLEKAIEIMENGGDQTRLPLSNLADCYEVEKDYEKAIACYEKDLQLFPQAYTYYKEIADLKSMLGKVEEAVSAYKKYSEEANNLKKWTHYINLAKIYLTSGDKKTAVMYYKKAVKEDKKNGGKDLVVLKLADYYLQHERDYKKTISLLKNVKHLEAYVKLANAYYYQGDEKKAKEYARLSLEQYLDGYGSEEAYISYKKEAPKRMSQLGRMHAVLGNDEQALKYFNAMMESYRCQGCRHGMCYDALLDMGFYYEGRKEYEKALEYYLKAYEINPFDLEMEMSIATMKKQLERVNKQ